MTEHSSCPLEAVLRAPVAALNDRTIELEVFKSDEENTTTDVEGELDFLVNHSLHRFQFSLAWDRGSVCHTMGRSSNWAHHLGCLV